ncbi:PepSY domain-containing protein [Tetragenococcus halophilus]|uniref:PepSY domain-containing protein n=1 Tax=Tetragenococcus halophilus TaxID=51669 RepID=A0AB35HNB9_TETHA|nr:PepSY domain-containing protein [Tetragenococcus halophilus]MCO8297759.1 PepSY domain-containing protein [Tetragenococcus halophilus]
MKHFKKTMIGSIAVAAVFIVGGSYAWASTSDKELDNSDPDKIEVTEEEALDTFADEYGKKVESIELEPTRDGYVYEVESYDNETEYNTDIDAASGDIIDNRSDKDDEDDDEEETRYELNQKDAISQKEATDIAEKEANSGKAREWKLERVSDDKQTWEVNVLEKGNETEVTMDAENGEVLEVEEDDD